MNIDLIDLDALSTQNKIVLQQTRKIQISDIEMFEEWKWLANQYKACIKDRANPQVCGSVSLFNSIFHQKRLVFGINRIKTAQLIQQDSNWPVKKGLKNGNYSKILGFLIKNKFIESIDYDKKVGQKIMLYKLIHPDLVKLITVDFNAQLEESISFALNNLQDEDKKEEEADSHELTEQEKLDEAWVESLSDEEFKRLIHDPKDSIQKKVKK